MDFTEIYAQTASLVAFSPGTHFILTAVEDRVIVRRSDNFQIARTWLVDSSPSPTQALVPSDPKKGSTVNSSFITHLAWSSDSQFILAACARRGIVQIFKLEDETWNARINAGVEGLVKAEWAPDGRTVLCFSEWGLRVTLWSLVTGTSTYIQYPLHPDRGYAFRYDGRYFVLAERHKSKDTIGVYDVFESFKLVRHFPVPSASLSSFSLSPNGNYVAIWEGPLEYKLIIMTLPGNLVATFTPDPDPGSGIRHVVWHPNGNFLACCGWDDRIYIIDSLTWSPTCNLDVPSKVPSGTTFWREPQNWIQATHGRGFLSYERLRGPFAIPTSKPTRLKSNPGGGISQLEWSRTGEYLLARSETKPTALYIYSFPSPSDDFEPKLKTVVINTYPINHAQWNPQRKGNLAFCTTEQSLYTWSDEWVGDTGDEEMAECIGVPTKDFETQTIRWSPDGKGIMMFGKDVFCCAFEVQEQEESK